MHPSLFCHFTGVTLTFYRRYGRFTGFRDGQGANANKELSLGHINTRSILAYNNESKSNQDKMDEIRQILCNQYEYSVIAVTETWLTSNTLSDDADLRVENYTFYRKDRKNGNSRGGGVGFSKQII